MNRNTSLPESAHECAASASMEAEPVTTAAPVLVTAIATFTISAITTVRRDSDAESEGPALAARSSGSLSDTRSREVSQAGGGRRGPVS